MFKLREYCCNVRNCEIAQYICYSRVFSSHITYSRGYFIGLPIDTFYSNYNMESESHDKHLGQCFMMYRVFSNIFYRFFSYTYIYIKNHMYNIQYTRVCVRIRRTIITQCVCAKSRDFYLRYYDHHEWEGWRSRGKILII